jgi:hypothetical protein
LLRFEVLRVDSFRSRLHGLCGRLSLTISTNRPHTSPVWQLAGDDPGFIKLSRKAANIGDSERALRQQSLVGWELDAAVATEAVGVVGGCFVCAIAAEEVRAN